MTTDSKRSTDIAIIGISCRFPMAGNPDEFWQLLRDGIDCITELSEGQFKASGIDPSVLRHPSLVKKGMVLEDYDKMDASFFGLSPRDAEVMDPQHRIFLEVAWEALENAGYDAEMYNDGLIGVYGGVDGSSYLVNIYLNPEVLQSVGMFTVALHNDKDSLTTRVAYKLNLKGPAVTVQSGGSTSLIAIIQACGSLLNYQCDMALAGGSSITLPHKVGYLFNEKEPYSKDGHTRVFDADASGTIAGSGAGVVVLKRLEDALADGDHIEAVIRGFGINNDGAEKVGFTAPGMHGQAEAIAMAQAMAGVSGNDISYVEAHGTGTVMGDPIEVGALTQVFGKSTERKGYCGLGSVKTNIGHCNSAAGVAGLIKTVLSLKHKMLPPSLHFVKPNPNIDFSNSPFYVVNSLRPWDAGHGPRLAGVSSFGIGGTNGHVVLEEAPVLKKSSGSRTYHLLAFSARTATALEKMCTRLEEHLSTHRELSLADVAYTLQTGRRRFAYRKIYVLPSKLATTEQGWLQQATQASWGPQNAERKQVVFLFPGQGSQYVNMGRGLYEQEGLFRQIVDDCCTKLEPLLGLDLRELLYGEQEGASDRLKQTAIAQPALFVISYAMARLWMSWGVQPDVMIGHSIGELAAACIAGVFSLEDALTLVAARGRLMQSMPEGAMVVVHCPIEQVQSLLEKSLSVAAINTPNSCVISGSFDSITALEQTLTKQGIVYQRLVTSHAFHSAMMDPVVEPFTRECAAMHLSPPQIPFVSNITGNWISPQTATDPSYWGKHIRSTVQFSASISELLKHSSGIYIETGAGNSLCTLLYQHHSKLEGEIAFPSLPHPKDKQPDTKVIAMALGQVWMAGLNINWNEYYHKEKRMKVALPSYPFERERYWIDPSPKINESPNVRKKELRDWIYTPSWDLHSIDNHNLGMPSQNGHNGKNGNGKTNGNGSGHTNILSAGNWLILDDGSETGEALSRELLAKGNKIWRVRRGNEFVQVSDHAIVMDPSLREHYSMVFKKLLEVQFIPDRLIHMWNFSNKDPGRDISRPERFYTLIYLAQELLQQNMRQQMLLKVVACNMHSLHEQGTVDPFNSLLTGACKVIGQEFPNISCQTIDLELPSGKFTRNQVVQNILQEVILNTSDELVVYRGDKRWVRSFRPANLASPGRNSVLRKHGVYLVTGGLSGIGLVLAKYLGKRYKARLILTGRSSFPDEVNWDKWLAGHPASDSTCEKIRWFRRLQQLGAMVMIETADVTKEEDIVQLDQRIRERFGKLNGIIHSAGVAGGGIIAVKKEELAAKVMNPKVKGTLVLEKVFGGNQLDFFVLCSSLSAVMGGVGQVDYCAANNFLDGFAHQKNKRMGTRYVSINWDTWGEVGMAVTTEVPEELKQAQEEALRNGIKNAEGVELFERILSGSVPQVLVSTFDLPRRIKSMATQQMLVQQSSKKQNNGKPHSNFTRPKTSTPYEPPANDIEQKLTEIWTDLLGLEQIGVNDNFLELGGHSLLAIQLSSRLRGAFRIEFSVQSFFESPTIRAIAAMIGEQKETGKGMEPEKPSLVKLSRDKYRVENLSGKT